jgi:hypothetical protein
MVLESHLRTLLIPLVLVVTANTAAWAAARAFGTHWAAPLDFGTTLRDGTKSLGSHKTWRGLIAAAVACGAAAQLFGFGFVLGMGFGTLAMLGDATSSFIKRRLRLPSGAEVPGLDQVPEAMLPLLALSRPLGLRFVDILVVTVIFALLDIAATRLRHL